MSAEGLRLELRVERPGFELALDECVPLTGVTAVFGPSGSGKSTLLRAIAGFERPGEGRVALAGEVWFDAARGAWVPPHRRPVGYMFQEARLFPHLDVAGNLDFAVRRSGGRSGRRGGDHSGVSRADVVAALDVDGLLARRVDELSGGERQRVALARTLLSAPRLLLLDEPLAALDRGRKADILPYLERVGARFHLPTLYVSHDVGEVARLADRVLVLQDGRVRMHGPAAEVLEHLELTPIIGRFEAGALLTGQVVRHEPRLHLSYVNVAGDEIAMPHQPRLNVDDPVRLRVRARDVALAIRRPEGISIRNVLPGTLTELVEVPGSGFVEALVALRGGRIRARVTLAAVEALELQPGMEAFALIKSVSFEGGD